MAVRGRDATVYLDKIDASPFLNAYELELEGEDIDVSHLGAPIRKFLSGPQEATLTLTGHWNGEEGDLDAMLDATFGKGVENIITICPAGVLTVGKAVYLTPAVQISNNLSAEVDEATELEAEFRASAADRAHILQTPVVLASASGAGAPVVAPAATSGGAYAHLHVLEVTGAPSGLSVVIEHSADGNVWSPLITFDNVTDPVAQRKVTAETTVVNEQLRMTYEFSGGTNPTATLVCAVGRG